MHTCLYFCLLVNQMCTTTSGNCVAVHFKFEKKKRFSLQNQVDRMKGIPYKIECLFIIKLTFFFTTSYAFENVKAYM